MEEIDNNTFVAPTPTDDLQVVVGGSDATDFVPVIEIQRAESSVAITLDDAGGTVEQVDEKLVYAGTDVNASFYPVPSQTFDTTHIRYIKMGPISPVRIAARYELDREVNYPAQQINVHWADQYSMMYYGYYDRADFLDESLITMPECRLSPWLGQNEPMVMNESLILVDVQYNPHRDDAELIHESMTQAVEQVLSSYGVTGITASENNLKRYFEHNGNAVKFFSTAFIGGHYYFYINLGIDYNAAHNYYRSDVTPSTIDQYAYGLNTVYNIPLSAIDEITARYAELYGLPLVEDTFTPEEEAELARLEVVLSDPEWIQHAERAEPYYMYAWEKHEEGFEFEIHLDSAPESNIIPFKVETDGLQFFWQEYRSGHEWWQPSRVLGSWAVYRPNDSGKAFHIYRPWAKDASGKKVWCELHIDTDEHGNPTDNVMTLTIPQEFLDNALYPVDVDPTFGYSTAGASTYSMSVGTIYGTVQTFTDRGWPAQWNGVFNLAGATGATAITQQGLLYGAGSSHFDLFCSTGTALDGISMALGDNTIYSGTNALVTIGPGQYFIGVWFGTWTSSYGGPAVITPKYDSNSKTSYTYTPGGGYNSSSPPTNIAVSSLTAVANTEFSFWIKYLPQHTFRWVVTQNTTAAAYLVTTATKYVSLYSTANVGANGTTTQAAAPKAILPNSHSFNNWKVTISPAPGSGQSITFGLNTNVAAGTTAPNSGLNVGISNTATSGSDTFYWASGDAGQDFEAVGYVSSASIASETQRWWRLYQYGTGQGLHAAAGTLSTTVARYLALNQIDAPSSTAAAIYTVMAESGTLRNFYFGQATNVSLSSGSYKATLVKYTLANGTEADTTVVLSGLTGSSVVSDTSTTISFVAGDYFYWRIDPSTGTAPNTATFPIALSCEYVSSTPGNGIMSFIDLASASTTLTRYIGPGGNGWNATETNVSAPAGDMVVTAMYVRQNAASGTSKSHTLTLRSGAADTSASVVISGNSATTGSWSGSVTIAEDSLIALSNVPSGTPSGNVIMTTIVYNCPDRVMPKQGSLLGVGKGIR